MAQRNRHHSHKRHKQRASAPPPAPLQALSAERKPPVVYGKPFILLEDSQKETFIYSGNQWVPHPKTIAECRQDSQVKELPQKINGMTRYEVCAPLNSVN